MTYCHSAVTYPAFAIGNAFQSGVQCGVKCCWRIAQVLLSSACAINLHGLPKKINIDKSVAKTATIRSVNQDACLNIELQQTK